jgi:hypothetical protein
MTTGRETFAGRENPTHEFISHMMSHACLFLGSEKIVG